MIWGVVAMLVGVIISVQLFLPDANLIPEIAFGR
jgi:cbb3-type cytochrome oxidase subunit 1